MNFSVPPRPTLPFGGDERCILIPAVINWPFVLVNGCFKVKKDADDPRNTTIAFMQEQAREKRSM